MKLLVMVLAVAAIAFNVGVEQAAGISAMQEKTDKQKNEEKDKDQSAEKISGDLGSKTNPVRCDFPKGEREYLNRLRCPDERRPQYSRIGSFGAGPYGNILDGYRVKCEGKDEVTIFMDMYHKDYIEGEAVPGFKIVNQELPQARLSLSSLPEAAAN